MKTPRVTDFDPNATTPKLKSSMDDFPVIENPARAKSIRPFTGIKLPAPLPEKPVIPEEQPNQAKPERPNARTPVRPNGSRIITRNSFEIYEDQMDSLRKVSFEEKMNGKHGSMSAMVREAIDSYLQKKSSGK